MSYILDALKKSEKERAQHHNPNITPTTSDISTPTSSYHLWTWGIGSLLLMILIILWSNHTTPSIPPSTPVTQATKLPSIAIKEASIPAKESLKSVSPVPITSVKAPIQPKRSITPKHQTYDEPAPTLHELSQAIRIKIPPLHIEAHVYDKDVKRRMVIINGNIEREGAWIDHKLQLIQITETGVLMSYESTPFQIQTFGQP